MTPVNTEMAEAIRKAYRQVSGVRAVYAEQQFRGQHVTLYVATERNDTIFQNDAFNAETTLEALFPDVFFVAQNRLCRDREPHQVFDLPTDRRVL